MASDRSYVDYKYIISMDIPNIHVARRRNPEPCLLAAIKSRSTQCDAGNGEYREMCGCRSPPFALQIFGIWLYVSLGRVVRLQLARPPKLLPSLMDPFIADCGGEMKTRNQFNFNFPFLVPSLYALLLLTHPTWCPLKLDTPRALSNSRPLRKRADYTKTLPIPSSATALSGWPGKLSLLPAPRRSYKTAPWQSGCPFPSS